MIEMFINNWDDAKYLVMETQKSFYRCVPNDDDCANPRGGLVLSKTNFLAMQNGTPKQKNVGKKRPRLKNREKIS